MTEHPSYAPAFNSETTPTGFEDTPSMQGNWYYRPGQIEVEGKAGLTGQNVTPRYWGEDGAD